ncbi:ALQxL family class IV lanthipeptide [Streptomyces wedmorensis]
MEIDLTELQMLPGEEITGLALCTTTCGNSCTTTCQTSCKESCMQTS